MKYIISIIILLLIIIGSLWAYGTYVKTETRYISGHYYIIAYHDNGVGICHKADCGGCK